jgi:hypothetical protein
MQRFTRNFDLAIVAPLLLAPASAQSSTQTGSTSWFERTLHRGCLPAMG